VGYNIDNNLKIGAILRVNKKENGEIDGNHLFFFLVIFFFISKFVLVECGIGGIFVTTYRKKTTDVSVCSPPAILVLEGREREREENSKTKESLGR
jgi:hypothetical protein